jgi:sterol desaturase/sphingolipid hydroxylase (fatty acid hydroxylase superfamily)
LPNRQNSFLQFEHRSQPLATPRRWRKRLGVSLLVAAAVIAVSLSIGILGYHFFAGMAWLDALVDAAMILAGMGQVNPLTNDAGKYFAAFYALFSGVVFIGTATILVAPWVHRVLHHFHLANRDDGGA